MLLGLVSGFLGGLLGIGGGVVIVPALYLIYDTTNRFDSAFILIIAIATSLSCIVFTSASAAYAQYKKQMVQWHLVRKLLLSLLVGSMLSGVLVSSLDPSILKIIIASFLAAVALVMISSWQPTPERRLPGLTGSSFLGIGAGIASGSAGIAGGNIIVPTLIFFNIQPHHATATSSFLGIPIAMSGALGYFLCLHWDSAGSDFRSTSRRQACSQNFSPITKKNIWHHVVCRIIPNVLRHF